MHLLCRGRLKLLVASLTAVVLLTWLYLLAGNLESEKTAKPEKHKQSQEEGLSAVNHAAVLFLSALSQTNQTLRASCSPPGLWGRCTKNH
ncbi:hypothetical protein CCH79_00006364 [Gambusia affinis]|uniref:Uncharacterized protein n=1 Tax=Gambusia affinis TaxID=33528 RepID=A0A315VZF4_GAMAF|nr:hypothetical protein CCH79_00006364 [Gambusia affinis]